MPDPTIAPPAPAPQPSVSPMNARGNASKWVIGGILVAGLAVAGYFLFFNKEETKSTNNHAAQDGKTILTYAVHWSDFQTDGVFEDGKLKSKGLNQYLDEYEVLHPDIDIQTIFLEFDDYPAGIKVLSDAGAAPDIYQIYSTWGVSMARDGILAEPPTDIQADVKKNYISTAGVTIDGKIWGIPTEINDYLLLYNKEMFKEAGIVDAQGNARPPKDWAETVDIAVKLSRKDASGRLTRYGFAFLPDVDDFTTDPFLSLMFTNGGHYLSDDHTKCLLNEPASVAALEGLLGLFRRGATDSDGNLWDFGTEKVAMVIMAPWAENDLRTSLGDRFDQVVGVASIPAMKKRATMQYSWFMGVTAGSQQKEKAWDFLRWFTQDIQPATGTTRYSDLLAQTIGAIPSRTGDVPKEAAWLGGNAFRHPFVEELPFSIPEPNVPSASEIKTALREQIQAAWVGKVSAKATMDAACATIDSLLAPTP